MAVVFYAVLQIGSSEWELASGPELAKNKVIAWAFMGVVLVYFALRIYTNSIGGLYTAKRIALGFILATNPIYQGSIGLILGLLVVELLFIIARVYVECPEDIFYMSELLKRNLSAI